MARAVRRRPASRAPRSPALPRGQIQPADIFRAIGIGTLLGVGGFVAFNLLDKPLSTVTVDAPFERVSALEVEARMKGHLPGGFLSVDLGAICDDLEALPWVDRARIRRTWPHSLQVTLTEQVGAARWGEAGLLNTRGELFVEAARHVPPELPRLAGPDGTEWQVSQRYLDYRQQLLRVGYDLSEVVLDERGAWRVRLSNGIEVRLGRSNPDARMARFVRDFTPLVEGRSDRVQYVDMRYSNGFAVGWRPAPGVQPLEGSEADGAEG